MAKNDNVKAVVAPRRSVNVNGKVFAPGEHVMLPLDEAVDLLKKGFLVDPNADDAQADVAEGPTVETAGAGTSVTPGA